MKHLLFAGILAVSSAPQVFANEDGAFLDAPYPNMVRAIDDAASAKGLKGKSNTNAVIDFMTPIRSQGSRGTCSIFSATAMIEGLMVIKGLGNAETNLSEEFLQYNVNAGSTSDGSYATKNFRSVTVNGMADETVLPYISENWTSYEDSTAQKRCGYLTDDAKKSCLIVHHDPSHLYRTDAELLDETKVWFDAEFVAARQDGQQFKSENLVGATYSSLYSTTQVKSLLDRGIPVIIEQDFYYGAWNHRTAESLGIPRNTDHWSKGIVGYPFPGSVDAQMSPTKRAGHSVLLVGYDDNVVIDFPVKMTDGSTKTFKLKGVYYFKNSWGTGSFGVDAMIDGVNREGYGTMTQQYAQDYGSFYQFSL